MLLFRQAYITNSNFDQKIFQRLPTFDKKGFSHHYWFAIMIRANTYFYNFKVFDIFMTQFWQEIWFGLVFAGPEF